MIITSASNPRIKHVHALRSARTRMRTGEILVEGSVEIERALMAGVGARSLYVPADADASLVDLASEAGAEVVTVAGPAQARISVRGTSSPILIATRPATDLEQTAPEVDLVLVAEALEKPGNIGALCRTADGAGAGLVVADEHSDIYGPNVVRSSLGTVFAVKPAAAPTPDVIDWLRLRGLRIVVTTPAGATPWFSASLAGPTAVVVGAEHAGVSAAWLDAADERVVLPMRGVADSLNASVTAGVLMYEAIRQRASSDD